MGRRACVKHSKVQEPGVSEYHGERRRFTVWRKVDEIWAGTGAVILRKEGDELMGKCVAIGEARVSGVAREFALPVVFHDRLEVDRLQTRKYFEDAIDTRVRAGSAGSLLAAQDQMAEPSEPIQVVSAAAAVPLGPTTICRKVDMGYLSLEVIVAPRKGWQGVCRKKAESP